MPAAKAKKAGISSEPQTFAISYLRFSTREQRKGDTVRRQLQMADEWSEKHGIPINERIRDAGVSAFRGKNALEGNLRRFLDLVQEGKIPPGTYLLVESLDRLSREAAHKAFKLMFDIISAGIRIVSLSDGMEYSEEIVETNPGALFLWLGTAIRSNFESVEKSKRIREVWAFKRKQAIEDKKVITARLPGWLRSVGTGKNRRIEVDPERGALVQKIFRMTIDGYGRQRILQYLNGNKIPPFRNSDEWVPSNLSRILCSRAAFGEFQAHVTDAQGNRHPDGDPIPDYFPAVVTQEEFNQASAAILSRRASPGPKGPVMANLLQGMVYCVSCGRRMALQNKGTPPKGQRYYACSGNERSAGCTNSGRWRVDVVENAVLDRAHQVDWSELDVGGTASLAILLSQKNAELTELNAKVARLLDAVEDGEDDKAAERYRKRRAEAKALKAEIKEMEAQLARENSLPPPGQREGIVAALRERLEQADPETALALRTKISQTLKWSVDRILFGRVEISVSYRSELRPYMRNGPAHKTIIARTPELTEAHRRDTEIMEELEAMELAEAGPVRRPFWRYVGKDPKSATK